MQLALVAVDLAYDGVLFRWLSGFVEKGGVVREGPRVCRHDYVATRRCKLRTRSGYLYLHLKMHIPHMQDTVESDVIGSLAAALCLVSCKYMSKC